MKNLISLFFLFGLSVLTPHLINAHNHNYVVVEQAPAQVIEVGIQTPISVLGVPIPIPEISVETAPPVELVETMDISPGEGYIWVKGHWQWEGRWVWNQGHWVIRPHPRAVWIPGAWSSRHNHWVWVEGRWE